MTLNPGQESAMYELLASRAGRVHVCGHRGHSLEAPENTMAAFQGAIDLGYKYLETDVHVTRDGVVIAFHDSRLDRVTDREGEIAEMSWD